MEVIILREGTVKPKNIDDENKIKQLLSTTVLVKTEKYTFLIDPGTEKNIRDLIQRMEKSGFSEENIDFVTYTHAHKDHMEALSYFLKKPVGIIEPFRKDAEKYFEPIEILKTVGHAKEHASFYIEKADVKIVKKNKVEELGEKTDIIICGDALINKHFFETGKLLPNTKSILDTRKSLEKIEKTGKFIIPGHGPAFSMEKVSFKPHNPTSEEYIEIIKKLQPDNIPVMTRTRGLKEYYGLIKKHNLPKPKFEPGERVLDLGCGYCRATYDIIQIVTGGPCTNELCFRHMEPYNVDALPSLVNYKCEKCKSKVDTGRVVGIDISEDALKKGEKYLRSQLDNRFLVIRATESNLKNVKLLEKYGVKSDLRRRRLSELDEKLKNRKIIPLYQQSIVEDMSLPKNYFDKIVSIHVLTYIEDIVEALLDILEVLKVKGEAYIIGARPFYILKKEITPEIWKKLLTKMFCNIGNPRDLIENLDFVDEVFPAQFYKEMFGNAVKVKTGAKLRSFYLKKLKDVDINKVRKRFKQPKEPWPKKRNEPMTIRKGYVLHSFYKYKE